MKENLRGVGIVVEYNPFHNGHKYHCEKAKEYGDVLIAVMSGNFVQRGEPAIVDKWKRAEMALSSGVDIVVELPCFYSTQSAEIFAKSSVRILQELGVEKIVFGSESGDIESLRKIAELNESVEFKERLKENLKEGFSYPTAYSKTLKELGVESDIKSNDILGIEYLKGIIELGNRMQGIALKRENVGYYEENKIQGISSATGIRKMLLDEKEFDDVVPKKSYDILKESFKKNEVATLEKFYPYIRYKILSEREEISKIQDVEVGYENKLFEAAMKNEEFSNFFQEINSKRYTQGRIQRVLIHILLGITKELTEEVKRENPYIQVLGFTNKGRSYLKKLKKENENLKILTSLKNLKKILSEKEKKFLEFNEKSGRIYSLINRYEEKSIPIMIEEREK